MSTLGIVAEFNPFHNGHKYLIEKAKEITGADNVVVIMSGNYVQRGEPAIFNKYSRAYEAVSNGASIVFELPVCYATASAELFATASVSFFNNLNCIDYLCFGCESDNINELMQIANILYDEPDIFKTSLKKFLACGDSFPIARKKALKSILDNDKFADIIDSPNNILAIEYLKAILRTKSNLEPILIKRTDNGYHSDIVKGNLASASAIRNMIQDASSIAPNNYIPDYKHIYSNLNTPIVYDDYSNLFAPVLYKDKAFNCYYDITEFLSNRIANSSNNYIDITNFINDLHSKNETKTHISRALLHILLNITKADIANFTDDELTIFANPLAFRKDSSIMQQLKNSSNLEIINKFGDFYSKQTGALKRIMDINIYADRLYNYIYKTKYNTNTVDDFSINNKNKIVL